MVEGEIGDEVDVLRGARDAMQRARDRSTDQLRNAERVERGADTRGDGERFGEHQRESSPGAQPTARRVSASIHSAASRS
ncbi:MAG: hypothetical protein R3F65_24445 [bacterium]